jgi:exosortase
MTDTEIQPSFFLSKGRIAAVVLLISSFAFMYHKTMVKLVSDWAADDNYSHGFFILPIALYFVWDRRSHFYGAKTHSSLLGLLLILASFATLMAGLLGSELFLTRISILGTIAGTILYIWGWQHLKILIFPILFLLLMIPIPAILFNQIAFPLQLLASRFGELALVITGIPVLREGNVIRMANVSLEIVEACSGIRSLITMLALAIVFGYFADRRIWARAVLAFAAFPIAILTNGFRVAVTGVAAHYFGSEAAQGLLHTTSGWLIFVLAFVMLFVLHRIIGYVAPFRNRLA